MKTKLILTLAALLLMVTGMRAQTPYAVYCEGDQSFHFLTAEAAPQVGGTLASNGLAITSVWEIDLQGNKNPKWYSSSETKSVKTVIFEDSFKDVRPQGCCGWFRGFSALSNIQNISLLNTSDMTDISSLFNGCSSLRSIDLSNFNTSNVTLMNALFAGCQSLQALNLRSFVTDNVTNMREMFNNCKGLVSLDLSSFNTANVTNMIYMFYGCSKLANLNLSNFNTENVTAIYGMFENCEGLTSVDLSSFNTSKIDNLQTMFRGCTSLKSVDLSGFNTEQVFTMVNMFSGCASLGSLNLCSFNTAEVERMGGMFNGCSNLATIYVSDTFTTAEVSTSSGMFTGCIQLRNYVASLTDKTNANYGPTGYLNFVGAHAVLADGSSALTFKNGAVDYNQPTYYFLNSGDDAPEWSGNEAIESVVFDESFSSARPTTCYGWFSSCPNLTVINGLGYLNTSELSAPSGIFAGCSGLRLVDMSQAAYDCSALLNNLTENALIYVPEGTKLSDSRSNVNVVIGETCEHFIFNNAGGSDQNLLSIPYPFTAQTVTIKREFKRGTPYSLHLPFAMSAIKGGTLYKYTGYTDTTVQFDPVEETEAHTPYMFTPDADLAQGIVINQSVDVEATTAEAAEGEGYIGVYKKKVFTEDEIESGLYFGWAETEFHPAGSGSSVDACRAYFKLPAGEATTARITAKFGDKVTTGLSQITVEQPAADSPAYNLNGQRVSDNHRGIIIKDGKKIINN